MVTFLVLGFYIVLMLIFEDTVFYHHSKVLVWLVQFYCIFIVYILKKNNYINKPMENNVSVHDVLFIYVANKQLGFAVQSVWIYHKGSHHFTKNRYIRNKMLSDCEAVWVAQLLHTVNQC